MEEVALEIDSIGCAYGSTGGRGQKWWGRGSRRKELQACVAMNIPGCGSEWQPRELTFEACARSQQLLQETCLYIASVPDAMLRTQHCEREQSREQQCFCRTVAVTLITTARSGPDLDMTRSKMCLGVSRTTGSGFPRVQEELHECSVLVCSPKAYAYVKRLVDRSYDRCMELINGQDRE